MSKHYRQDKKSPGLNASELKGLLLLLPIIMVISVVLYFVKRPQNNSMEVPSAIVDSLYAKDNNISATEAIELSFFDPNTADLRTFLRLGLSSKCAVSVIKYREGGKVFSIKEDFATCYGLSEDDYFRLEPYIVIGEEYKKKRKYDSGAPAQKGRSSERSGAVPSQREVKDVSVLAEEEVLIDINRADSALLRTVRGIGDYTVKRIIGYRAKLGGFVCDSQLMEIKGLREENFRLIQTQIFVDSCVIQKIDVNFATQKQINDALSGHPYAGAVVVRKLLKMRQLKGGWRTIGDLVHDEILNQEQAKKLAPYLIFN